MKRISLVLLSLLLISQGAWALSPRFSDLTRAAEQGDPYAQYQLGSCYFYGEGGVDQDHAQACKWYRQAVMNLRSWFALEPGRSKEGRLIPRRDRAAIDEIEARFHLASQYHYGEGVAQDYTAAAKWYRRAALDLEAPPHPLSPSRGDLLPDDLDYYTFRAWDERRPYIWGRPWTRPWYRLGRTDLSGLDLKAFHAAAEAGDIEAQYQLGLKYYRGEGVSRNFETAARYLHSAALRIIAGAFSDRSPDTYETMRFADLDDRATGGELPARFYLGMRYFSGNGVPRNPERAATCFKEVIENSGDLPWPPFPGRKIPDLSSSPPPDLDRVARLHDPSTMFEFGNRYYFGEGVARDYAQAARWYRKAAERSGSSGRDRIGGVLYRSLPLADLRARAEKGDPEAAFTLGERYFFGLETGKDLAEAAKWYRLAASEPLWYPRYGYSLRRSSLRTRPLWLGSEWDRPWNTSDRRLTEEDIRFMREVDRLPPWYPEYRYEAWSGDPELIDVLARTSGWHEPFPWLKYREAYRGYRDLAMLRKEAEAGHPDAQFFLGTKYYFGMGVPLNKEEASRWFRKSAMQGNPMARYYLSLVYERHEDRMALETAARNGNAEAQYQMGTIYHFAGEATRDFDEAARWYAQAARKGHSMAQFQLGIVEFSRQHFSEAVSWLKKSAAQGNVLAQYNLGILYNEGKGVNQDLDEAERWFRRLAEKGSLLGQGMIATLNQERARGDKAAGAVWFRKAVEDGLVNPRLDLGLIHDEGLGLAEYTRKAYAWLSLILEGRTLPWAEEYRAGLRQLEARLSPAEIEEARGLAAKLKETVTAKGD